MSERVERNQLGVTKHSQDKPAAAEENLAGSQAESGGKRRTTRMRIAVDAMGGDRAPDEIVQGALRAAECSTDAQIIIVGRKGEIKRNLEKAKPANRVNIVHADQVIGMDEPPVVALRKKRNSSITRSAAMLRSGEADAMVSAGNTGAVVASTIFLAKKLEGVKRPGIAIPFPTDTEKGICIIIDAGANLKCKPVNLLQYAVMGRVYSRQVIGVDNPRVALVNVGAEDAKGNSLVKESRGLLKDADINFVGSVEGQELFKGICDVAVCEGFVGNVILKVAEGMGEGMLRWLKQSIDAYVAGGGDKSVAKALFASQNVLGNYSEYGGAPLLGINGVCIICHGRSDATAIHNAIKVAQKAVEKKVNEKIMEKMKALGWMWRLSRFFERESQQ
jgi:glycerol-3-phosphate acyltransferase PlsX